MFSEELTKKYEDGKLKIQQKYERYIIDTVWNYEKIQETYTRAMKHYQTLCDQQLNYLKFNCNNECDRLYNELLKEEEELQNKKQEQECAKAIMNLNTSSTTNN